MVRRGRSMRALGAAEATPIMRWLASIEGPVDQFNDSVVVAVSPADACRTDVAIMLQALPAFDGMFADAASTTMAGGWSLTGAEPGSVQAGERVQTVAVPSDAALVAARSRLNPTAGVMTSALWVADAGRLVLIIHHLAVDAVSWRILLEDLNIGWAHIAAGSRWRCRPVGRRLPGGRGCLPSTPMLQRWSSTPRRGSRWRPPRPRCHRCNPRSRRSRGALSVSLDSRAHPHVVGCGARGVSRRNPGHLVDRVRVVGGGILRHRWRTRHDVEGHGRHEESTGDVDLSRTVGCFTTTHPVSLTVGGLSGAGARR